MSSMADRPYASPEEVARAEDEIRSIFRRGHEELLRRRPERCLRPSDDTAIFGLADRAVHEYLDATASDPALPRVAPVQLFEIRRRLFLAHNPFGPLAQLVITEAVEDIHVPMPASASDGGGGWSATMAPGSEPLVVDVPRQQARPFVRKDTGVGRGGGRRRDRPTRRCPSSGRRSSREWRT